jgi:hypothetical protein
VQVDESGQGDEAVAVDDRRAGGIRHRADLRDEAILDEEVGALAVRQRRAGDEVRLAHHDSPRSPDNRR